MNGIKFAQPAFSVFSGNGTGDDGILYWKQQKVTASVRMPGSAAISLIPELLSDII